MSKYVMRKVLFVEGAEINIPNGSLDIKIVRDPVWDDWALMYLELVQV